MSWQFTYDGLRKYFAFLGEQGTVTSFENMDKVNNPIVLRHDVDLDPTAAFYLAGVESKFSIKSTFFFRVASPTYNIFALKFLLHWFCEKGFEIGLHFDPAIYSSEIQHMCELEIKILESMLPKKSCVKSISLHNPSIYKNKFSVEGFIDAYDKKVWGDSNYISDSCKNFRAKEPYEFVRAAKKPMQILLHPLYYAETDFPYSEIIKRYISNQIRIIHRDYGDNPAYVKDMKGKKLEICCNEKEK